MEKVLEMRRKRKQMIDEMRSTIDTAQNENRALTDDEKNQYEEKRKEVNRLKEEEERHVELNGLEDEVRDLETAEPNKPDIDPNQNKADERKWGSFGEFLSAVVQAGTPGGTVDQRLVMTAEEKRQAGLSSGVAADGGYLVQTQHIEELLRRTYETGILAQRCRRIPIGENANGLTINAIDESSRATGSRWGGVQGYWLSEAGTKQASQPKLRQMELKLKKLAGLCYATDELLQDAAAMENIINQAFPEEFGWMLDESIYTGTGVGQPLGFMNSGSLVTVPAETNQPARTVLFENISKMWSRMWARSRANAVWLINQDVEPELDNMALPVGTGGVPVYLPAGGLSDSPYGRIKGRPVIPIEHSETLGTAGDIVLADLSQYLMIDKGNIQSASSIHVRFVYDETAFRFVMRVDGQPTWNQPLTPAKGANTLSPFVALADRT